jgi:hypothetical protein
MTILEDVGAYFTETTETLGTKKYSAATSLREDRAQYAGPMHKGHVEEAVLRVARLS